MTMRLRQEHNYCRFADNCKNCKHFSSNYNYGGVENMTADVCELMGKGDLQVLIDPWGVCDSHERRRKRR